MTDTEQLTREQAEACLKIVQDWIDEKYGPGYEVKLYDPGFHCTGWALVLTGMPDEWPWLISQAGHWPQGVFAEPGSDWYLGLYIEWSSRPAP